MKRSRFTEERTIGVLKEQRNMSRFVNHTVSTKLETLQEPKRGGAGMEPIAGPTAIIFLIFLVLLAILWVILPFAIFGTKPILREKLDVDREMLAELKAIRSLLEKAQTGQGGSGPGRPPLVAGR